jgi:hypothetical protein
MYQLQIVDRRGVAERLHLDAATQVNWSGHVDAVGSEEQTSLVVALRVHVVDALEDHFGDGWLGFFSL